LSESALTVTRSETLPVLLQDARRALFDGVATVRFGHEILGSDGRLLVLIIDKVPPKWF